MLVLVRGPVGKKYRLKSHRYGPDGIGVRRGAQHKVYTTIFNILGLGGRLVPCCSVKSLRRGIQKVRITATVNHGAGGCRRLSVRTQLDLTFSHDLRRVAIGALLP